MINLLAGCAGSQPSNLGITAGQLAPCPARDNCVSSDASSDRHKIEPFQLAAPAGEVWSQLRAAVSGLPHTEVITSGDDYLHAECKSRIFRFVDDLELHLRADRGIIAVRSASRVGRGDMGVNRKRVENLRKLLTERGLLK